MIPELIDGLDLLRQEVVLKEVGQLGRDSVRNRKWVNWVEVVYKI